MIEYYDEVLQEATNTATDAAVDILCQVMTGKYTIEDMLHEDIVEAIHAIAPQEVADVLREDHYEEIMSDLQTNFTQYLIKKL